LPRVLGSPRWLVFAANALVVLVVGVVLTSHWLPLGPARGLLRNLVFVAGLVGGVLGLFYLFQRVYEPILRWCLRHKLLFLSVPTGLLVVGASIWLGFGTVFGFVPASLRPGPVWRVMAHTFPGLGKEFMPPLDEGSYLLMPTTMPHASIGECLDVLAKQDRAIRAIPEVETVVGKIGRVESPLDPAPISMIETIITYKSEYATDKDGHRLRFRYDDANHTHVRDEDGKLIPDPEGRPYRQWREHIKKPDDIWDEIVTASRIPGTTSAPRLQPIAARIVMLQSGMRAPMGVKVKGPDLDTIETVGLAIEKFLKKVPSVQPAAVVADRIVGKPYLEVDIDRKAIARYGVPIRKVQDVIEVAIGGKPLTTTVEGRERYPVRVRYARELRDTIEAVERILVPAADGAQIPLSQLSDIRYVRGPQMIKSEDTSLVGYVVFDKKPGYAEVDVVEQCDAYLKQQETVFGDALRDAEQRARAEGRELTAEEIDALPGLNRRGCDYKFAGSYENQLRAQKRLSLILPVALFLIFLILYLQFRRVSTTMLVFSGIAVAWAGGFIMIWLYAQPWFLNFHVFGVNMQDLFQVHPFNMSVAVWVGFLALFGIATDDGVVMATYLKQRFAKEEPDTIQGIREATVHAGLRRVRPCLMTTATTVLALIPVLTSTGRGADVMVPMAIPSFGGMCLELITMFVVPVCYATVREFRKRTDLSDTAVDMILLFTAFLPGFLFMAVYCAVADVKGRRQR
jgi:Cu(I)/Ag(I) efflux system membrane protein CusA/SilA